METKLKEGEVVFEKNRPHQKLIITKINGNLFFCETYDDSRRTQLVFYERDLASPVS